MNYSYTNNIDGSHNVEWKKQTQDEYMKYGI